MKNLHMSGKFRNFVVSKEEEKKLQECSGNIVRVHADKLQTARQQNPSETEVTRLFNRKSF